MAAFELYWHPQTRASRIVWLLEEAGVDYSLHDVDIRDEGARGEAAFRAVSPMGKVPALRHGQARIFDSAAICLYVADAVPAAGLAPAPGHPDRGAYYAWMVFAPGCIEPAMAEKFSGMTPNRVAHGWGDFDTVMATLSDQLGAGTWVLGETFSAADIMIGSSLNFMKMFGILPADDTLLAYIDRCTARPAFQAAMARDAGGQAGS